MCSPLSHYADPARPPSTPPARLSQINDASAWLGIVCVNDRALLNKDDESDLELPRAFCAPESDRSAKRQIGLSLRVHGEP